MNSIPYLSWWAQRSCGFFLPFDRKISIGNKNLDSFVQLSCLNYETERKQQEKILILQNPVAWSEVGQLWHSLVQ